MERLGCNNPYNMNFLKTQLIVALTDQITEFYLIFAIIDYIFV
jgi:type III secretory pathway component EscU